MMNSNHKKRKSKTRRRSTNPFDSSDDEKEEDFLVGDEFHECRQEEAPRRSAPLNFDLGHGAAETSAPALVFDDTHAMDDRKNDFFSPLESAFLRMSGGPDVLSPSTAGEDDHADHVNADTEEEEAVPETQWSRLVRMANPLRERILNGRNAQQEDSDSDGGVRNNKGEDVDSSSVGEPSLSRRGSQASFQSARSADSDIMFHATASEDSEQAAHHGDLVKKSPGRRTGSLRKKRRSSVVQSKTVNPVLEKLEYHPKDSEYTMNYRSTGTPWTHLILLEDLGTASSYAVLLVPYIAFLICLVLDLGTELRIHTVGPLSAAAPCVKPNGTVAGYNVPLIPSPSNACSYPFTLSTGKGILSYGGKGYRIMQSHYQALMSNGTAFASGPLEDVPAMSTFLYGDVSFTNLPTEAVALVSQGHVISSTVVMQRKNNIWVPVSISKPSRLSMACSHSGNAASWNCNSPRIVDVLFSLPGTGILTGGDIEVDVLYSYYKGPSSSEMNSLEYYSEDAGKDEFAYVFSESPEASKMLEGTAISHPRSLVAELVSSSTYTIEHERSSYKKIDIAVRMSTLIISIGFLVFWWWSLGLKGFFDGCSCDMFCCVRRRRDSEEIPLTGRKSGDILWWESPWLLLPERRYLLMLLFCLLLVQNPLLAYAYFQPSLYGRAKIHAAADAIVGIGVHGILMFWLCLVQGLRYHTASIARKRAKQQRQVLELRRTANYMAEADPSVYGTEASISRYTAQYYDQYGDIDGSGSSGGLNLRMKHDPCGDNWADFLLPKLFLFLLGAASVLITAIYRFPQEGDNAATLDPGELNRYNAIYVFSSFAQLLILVLWVVLIMRNAYITGSRLRKEPFLSTRPAQLAFRVLTGILFLGLAALWVPFCIDVFKLIKKWSLEQRRQTGGGEQPHSDLQGSSISSALDVLLRVLSHVSQRFPYSGTAASIGPGKILYATACSLVAAFIFLPNRPFHDETGEDKQGQARNPVIGGGVFQKALSEKMRQRRDKRMVVTLARFTHTWRVFPLAIEKATLASDLLSGGSFHLDQDFRISYRKTNARGVIYVGRYTPVFCLELACWLLEASWQSYYSPKEFSTDDWAPGRMSLENIGLLLEKAIYDEITQTQAFVATNIAPQIDGEEDSVIVIAFRGSANAKNVRTDLRFGQAPLPEQLMGVDDRPAFQVHADHIDACDYDGWEHWVGPLQSPTAVQSYSPRKAANAGDVAVQWRTNKPSPFTAVSNVGKAVVRATPLARQALPCVHEGFLEVYSHIRKQVMESVLEVLQRQFSKAVARSHNGSSDSRENCKAPPLTLPKIYITGHSMGGAVAQLLALDIASNCELVIQVSHKTTPAEELFSLPGVEAPCSAYDAETPRTVSSQDGTSKRESPDEKKPRNVFFASDDFGTSNTSNEHVSTIMGTSDTATRRSKSLCLQPPIAVYTYGQPRLGNHAFARLYKQRVPHTFRVANEGDAFTGIPQFSLCGGFYKHAGLEVLLDEGCTGNTLVGPTVVETMFRFTKVRRRSVAAHSMEKYRDCLESALSQDELQEYYRGHGGNGSAVGASRPFADGGVAGGGTTTLPDWVTQVKRSSLD